MSTISCQLSMRGERNETLSTHTYKFFGCRRCSPVVMIITQLIKKMYHIKPFWVPTIALVVGLFISIFISHRHNLLAGLFMGWFYGYAAMGSYASLKTSYLTYKQKKRRKQKYTAP